MQSKSGWIAGAAAGLMLIVGLSSAEAGPHKKFKSEFGGTFLGTNIDLFPLGAPDGVKAGWVTSAASGTFGKRTTQGVSEEVPTGPTTDCPGGVFIIDQVTDPAHPQGFGTLTDTYPNGDQAYAAILTRTECHDVNGGFKGSETGIILGGTGKFAGVSGTFEDSYTGFFQVFDPTVGQGFGSFTGTAKGEVIFP